MFRARLADIERLVHPVKKHPSDAGAKVGKGVYGGAHTRIVVGDEGTVWPMELDSAAAGFRRWGDDGFNPATEEERKGSAGHRLKIYELKLLAGFAQCYRRQIPLDKLPMIPVDFAVTIIKSGGLTNWINSDEKRLRRFWGMVRDQTANRRQAGVLLTLPS
jgi:hypothetical protein